MQVDLIKLTLKAPRSKLLKLKQDKLLSNFAFNFNLRRYSETLYIPANSLTSGSTYYLRVVGCVVGRGLHSSTFQLNLSRF